MEHLKDQELTRMMGFKVSDTKHDEILKFCAERDFNMSKFIRYAIDESMKKIIKEGK